MPVAIITGLGRPDRLRGRRALHRRGLRRRRHRERHAGPLLRPRVLDLARDRAPRRRALRVPLGERRHPRRATRSSGSSASTPGRSSWSIHTAAQPSHDWAASEPQTDFGVNANGTLNLLEAARAHCPDAPFIFCSTNKVYGDTPEPAAAGRPREAARAARVPPLLQRHRHLDVDRHLAPTRCSASPRRRPTCWCRSTAATSTCRPSASAAAA